MIVILAPEVVAYRAVQEWRLTKSKKQQLNDGGWSQASMIQAYVIVVRGIVLEENMEDNPFAEHFKFTHTPKYAVGGCAPGLSLVSSSLEKLALALKKRMELFVKAKGRSIKY